MTPSPDDLDPLAGLPPAGATDSNQQEQQRSALDGVSAVAGDVTVGAVELIGQGIGAAAEAGGAMAEAAGSLAEGAGTALGAAADGCSGCSCAIVVALGLALSAGSALAAQLLR